MPTRLENYLFDLRGYLLFEQAVPIDVVAEINDRLDEVPSLEPGEWYGRVMRQNHPANRGVNLQNLAELGGVFEELLDYPAWLEHARAFIGHREGLAVTEYFANIRGQGGAINIHSGGHAHTTRTRFDYHDGEFHCGEINVLLALTDIGPGDGATMVIPGSHKSNIEHPVFEVGYSNLLDTSSDGVEGAIEIHMKAGDVGLFVDCLCHGAAARVNDGERRVLILRYTPAHTMNYHGFVPSDDLLARLSPERRKLLQHRSPLLPPAD